MGLERDRHLLEAQVKDSANRLDDAEQNALKVRLREYFQILSCFFAKKLNVRRVCVCLQCCGSGSGIWCFLNPWIRDGKNPDPGCGINIPDHISESLVSIVWVKNT